MKKTILIVESNQELSDTLVQYFNLLGMHVVIANNGSQAFAICQDQHIDLVIVDVQLHNSEDGNELLTKLRSRSPKHPIVIFVLGFADSMGELLLKKGANAVFTKPFELHRIAGILAQFLG